MRTPYFLVTSDKEILSVEDVIAHRLRTTRTIGLESILEPASTPITAQVFVDHAMTTGSIEATPNTRHSWFRGWVKKNMMHLKRGLARLRNGWMQS